MEFGGNDGWGGWVGAAAARTAQSIDVRRIVREERPGAAGPGPGLVRVMDGRGEANFSAVYEYEYELDWPRRLAEG